MSLTGLIPDEGTCHVFIALLFSIASFGKILNDKKKKKFSLIMFYLLVGKKMYIILLIHQF